MSRNEDSLLEDHANSRVLDHVFDVTAHESEHFQPSQNLVSDLSSGDYD